MISAKVRFTRHRERFFYCDLSIKRTGWVELLGTCNWPTISKDSVVVRNKVGIGTTCDCVRCAQWRFRGKIEG